MAKADQAAGLSPDEREGIFVSLLDELYSGYRIIFEEFPTESL